MNEYNVHGQSMYRVHAQYCHRSGVLKIDHTYVLLLVNNEDIFLDVSGWSDILYRHGPPRRRGSPQSGVNLKRIHGLEGPGQRSLAVGEEVVRGRSATNGTVRTSRAGGS